MLYEALENNLGLQSSVELWGENYSLSITAHQEDEFEGGSIITLLTKFGTDTMYLWYALLLGYVSIEIMIDIFDKI